MAAKINGTACPVRTASKGQKNVAPLPKFNASLLVGLRVSAGDNSIQGTVIAANELGARVRPDREDECTKTYDWSDIVITDARPLVERLATGDADDLVIPDTRTAQTQHHDPLAALVGLRVESWFDGNNHAGRIIRADDHAITFRDDETGKHVTTGLGQVDLSGVGELVDRLNAAMGRNRADAANALTITGDSTAARLLRCGQKLGALMGELQEIKADLRGHWADDIAHAREELGSGFSDISQVYDSMIASNMLNDPDAADDDAEDEDVDEIDGLTKASEDISRTVRSVAAELVPAGV
jgi:hypothetical protein